MAKSVFEKLTSFAREHWIAVVLSICTSLIVAAPQIYLRIDHPEFYAGGYEAVEMLPDAPWSVRVREVMDGHTGWGNFYFKDGKDDPYLFQPLGSFITAWSGMLFGLEINNTLLLFRLVYPAITFFVIYAFAYLIGRNKLVALASTSLILFVESVMSPAGVRDLLAGFNNGVSPLSFLELARPVNSAMIFIFLFGFLAAFWRYYETNKRWWGVLAAVLLGLNFYNYFYSWTYAFSFGGALAVVLIIERNWGEVRRLLYVFIGGLLVGLPYLYNLYTVTLHPNYEEVARRHGVVVSHDAHFIGVTAFAALIFFLIAYPRKNWMQYRFAIALLMTPFITLNQQIVTGKILQEGHYHWYMHKPLAIILGLLTIFYLFSRFKLPMQYQRLFAIAIIVPSFILAISIQAFSYLNDRPSRDGGAVMIDRQRYAPMLDWLNKNTPKDAVVYAEDMVSHIIVIYTPLNLFQHRSDQLMLSASDKRMEDIFFTRIRLEGITDENAREYFYENRALISTRMFGVFYRDSMSEGRYDSIPDEKLDELIEKYTATLDTPTDQWIYDMWKKYEVEFLVWDMVKNPNWKPDRFPFLKKEATFSTVAVYSVSDSYPQ